MKSGTKVLGVLTALAIMLAGFAQICDADNSDAAIYTGAGTQGDPYTKIDCTAEEFFYKYNYGDTIYLKAGCTVKITDVEYSDAYFYVESTYGQPNLGMTQTSSQFGGTATAGTSIWYAVLADNISGEASETRINVTVIDTSIPYNAPTNLTPITGANWYYTPTAMDGVTIGIDGAPWLSTAGNAIYGTPATPGDYTVTITLSKAGYTTSTHTFTLSVASQLVPTNSPTNGIIIYAV